MWLGNPGFISNDSPVPLRLQTLKARPCFPGATGKVQQRCSWTHVSIGNEACGTGCNMSPPTLPRLNTSSLVSPHCLSPPSGYHARCLEPNQRFRNFLPYKTIQWCVLTEGFVFKHHFLRHSPFHVIVGGSFSYCISSSHHACSLDCPSCRPVVRVALSPPQEIKGPALATAIPGREQGTTFPPELIHIKVSFHQYG